MDNTQTKVPAIYGAINKISNALAAPKTKTNGFGKYKYRDLPSLRNALKPLLTEYGVFFVLSQSKTFTDNRDQMTLKIHLVSTEDNSVVDSEITINCDEHKGMSAEQASGSALTYAEKYLLCMVFHVDDDSDAADPDSQDVQSKDKTAFINDLNNAIDDLRSATTNDELTAKMHKYKAFWDNAEFKKTGATERARLTNKGA